MTIFLQLIKISLINQLQELSKSLENRLFNDQELSRQKRRAIDSLIADIEAYEPEYGQLEYLLDEEPVELRSGYLYISCQEGILHYRININQQIMQGSFEKSEMVFEFYPEELLTQAELYSYKIQQLTAKKGFSRDWDNQHMQYLRSLIDRCESTTTQLANDAGRESNTTEKKLGKLKDFLDNFYKKIQKSGFENIPYEPDILYFHVIFKLADYLLKNAERVEEKKNASFLSFTTFKSQLTPNEVCVRLEKEKLVVEGLKELEARIARINYRLSDYKEQVQAEIKSFIRELCNSHQEVLNSFKVNNTLPVSVDLAWGLLGINFASDHKPGEGKLGDLIDQMRTLPTV